MSRSTVTLATLGFSSSFLTAALDFDTNEPKSDFPSQIPDNSLAIGTESAFMPSIWNWLTLAGKRAVAFFTNGGRKTIVPTTKAIPTGANQTEALFFLFLVNSPLHR
jgi:hypothetical protein